jgi:5-methylcytosine-specific restriction endonuclease McrA
MGRAGRAIPRPKPRVVLQRERRVADRLMAATVRTAVWRRDSGRCRTCGARGAHVHHLRFRSRGGRWTTANCLLLCRRCHQDVHARILVLTGDDADRPDAVTWERHRWW